MSDTLIFKLSKTIEYSRDGNFVKTATLELEAPSMNCFDEALELSQAVMKAVMDAADIAGSAEENSVKQEGAISRDAMRMLLLSSNRVPFKDVSKICRNLFVKVGTYDGKTSLINDTFKKLSVSDFSNMIFDYCANFIFPSLFSAAGEDEKANGDIS